jgi:hypothetical protein
LPDIEASIWQKYKYQDVLVYGIYDGELQSSLDDFAEQTGVTFPLVKDQGTLYKFAFPEGVGYPYPRDVIIGKDLTVRSIKNSFDPNDIDELIQQLLAEPAP